MAKGWNASRMGKKAKPKLIVRLLIPMLALVVLQIAVFFTILILGGEFTYVEHYAYSTLVEKTETRRDYLEAEFQQKAPFVQESAERINRSVDVLLQKQGATISDLQADKDLVHRLVSTCVDDIVDLLRRSTVNDAYLILETGDLYDGGNAKAALYLRDLDTMTDAGYEDLLMEMGFTSIAQEHGIILDSGWSLRFEPDPEDMKNYDFYYTTMETAQQNTGASLEALGYWSSFSTLSNGVMESMKYSVPLIAEDGTVYGILGIGLTENSVLANLPVSDFMDETACYVLGRGQDNRAYSILTHSGTAFPRLIGNSNTLRIGDKLDENVNDFAADSNVPLAGSVQPIRLYDMEEGPYSADQWVLISVADRSSVLRPLNDMQRMLVIAALVSMLVSIVVIILSSRSVVRPIAAAIRTMNAKWKSSEIIRFQPSNIYEIDEMTDAITRLQINVQDFSSQVSQMIRIADVGLGTFMYDRSDDTVFVGQSLLGLLRHQEQEQQEDVIMPRQEFIDRFISDECRSILNEAMSSPPTETGADYIREFSYTSADGATHWLRLSLVYNQNKTIGILQDITGAMMEKRRIEYERDFDVTTGLLNRRAYNEQLAELFHNKENLKITAIIMMDLDNLKYVNDTYGHDFGDEYIKTAANMLKRFQSYGGIVSRLSGDEFNVCLPGFNSKEEARKVIEQVRQQLMHSSCLLADGSHFNIRASMGVSWYPDDAQSFELLMKYADFAMYTVKHATKGDIAEFDMDAYTKNPSMTAGVEEANRIIDEGRVRYAFQGILSAKTGQIYGYEALMRPLSNIFQSHLELLRTAKTGSRLYELERLTWQRSLEDFQAQIDAGNIADDSCVFINSIANCALSPSDMDAVESAHRKLLNRIVMEVLESEAMDKACIARKLMRMQKWNAQVALDDFGINYDNGAVLSSLKPNIIKIDRSIISGCDKDNSRQTIISNLVKVAKKSHTLVLAGGVETEQELRTVISCGVDLLQGYYLNRPLFEPQPVSPEVMELLQSIINPGSNA